MLRCATGRADTPSTGQPSAAIIIRTIERAISAKDDYMLAVKVSQDAQIRLGQLVQAGVFGTRAEAAAFLIDEGIQGPGTAVRAR
jgi:hypothetical protein